MTAINVGFWLFCGLFFLSQVPKVVHLLHVVFSTAIVFVVHSGDLHNVILILGNDLDLQLPKCLALTQIFLAGHE